MSSNCEFTIKTTYEKTKPHLYVHLFFACKHLFSSKTVPFRFCIFDCVFILLSFMKGDVRACFFFSGYFVCVVKGGVVWGRVCIGCIPRILHIIGAAISVYALVMIKLFGQIILWKSRSSLAYTHTHMLTQTHNGWSMAYCCMRFHCSCHVCWCFLQLPSTYFSIERTATVNEKKKYYNQRNLPNYHYFEISLGVFIL